MDDHYDMLKRINDHMDTLISLTSRQNGMIAANS